MKILDPRAQVAPTTLTTKNQESITQTQQSAPTVLPIWPLNSIRYTRQLLGDVGVTTIYALIGAERLDVRKLGKLTRITGESVKALIESLPRDVVESPRPEGFRDPRRSNARKPQRAPIAVTP